MLYCCFVGFFESFAESGSVSCFNCSGTSSSQLLVAWEQIKCCLQTKNTMEMLGTRKKIFGDDCLELESCSAHR
jgi:hypothetical protein